MGLWGWLQGIFGETKPARPTRLTSEQALELARAAAEREPLRDYLSTATVEERHGAMVWLVSTVTKGKSLDVEIDDSTGKILGIHSGGVR